MSNRLDVQHEAAALLERRRSSLLVPAILATCVGLVLMGLATVLHVLAAILFAAHPEWWGPAGVTYIPPSASERAEVIVRSVVPIIVGLGFVALTWRYRSQGRRAATLTCAAGTILMGIISVW